MCCVEVPAGVEEIADVLQTKLWNDTLGLYTAYNTTSQQQVWQGRGVYSHRVVGYTNIREAGASSHLLPCLPWTSKACDHAGALVCCVLPDYQPCIPNGVSRVGRTTQRHSDRPHPVQSSGKFERSVVRLCIPVPCPLSKFPIVTFLARKILVCKEHHGVVLMGGGARFFWTEPLALPPVSVDWAPLGRRETCGPHSVFAVQAAQILGTPMWSVPAAITATACSTAIVPLERAIIGYSFLVWLRCPERNRPVQQLAWPHLDRCQRLPELWPERVRSSLVTIAYMQPHGTLHVFKTACKTACLYACMTACLSA
jgi:hypothetical protein